MWILWIWQISLLVVVVFGWLSMHHVFKVRYGKLYETLSRTKQTYIVKNTVKSILLSSISPLALYGIVRIAVYGMYDSILFRIFGCVYASSDIVGLLVMNKRLPISTLLHHTCVVVFSIKNMSMDYTSEDNDPFRQISMLGAFSALTWIVNTHLGLRTLLDQQSEYRLRKISLFVYLPTVLVSFSWQLLHALPFVRIDVSVLYLLAILLIFYDDCVLISFLSREENRRVLFLYSILIIPITIHWNAGHYPGSIIEFAVLLFGVANECFQHSCIELASFFVSMMSATYGIRIFDKPVIISCAQLYLILCAFLFQKLHTIVESDPILYVGSIVCASMLRLYSVQ